jgi:hypothetical protein
MPREQRGRLFSLNTDSLRLGGRARSHDVGGSLAHGGFGTTALRHPDFGPSTP